MTVPQEAIQASRYYWIVVKGPGGSDCLEIGMPYFDENGAVSEWECRLDKLRPDEVRRVVQAVPEPTWGCCPRCYGPTRVRYPGGDPENGPARSECLDGECQAEQDEEEMRKVREDYTAAGKEAEVIADQMICSLPSLATVRTSLVMDIMNSKWHHVARTVATHGFKSIATP